MLFNLDIYHLNRKSEWYLDFKIKFHLYSCLQKESIALFVILMDVKGFALSEQPKSKI